MTSSDDTSDQSQEDYDCPENHLLTLTNEVAERTNVKSPRERVEWLTFATRPAMAGKPKDLQMP